MTPQAGGGQPPGRSGRLPGVWSLVLVGLAVALAAIVVRWRRAWPRKWVLLLAAAAVAAAGAAAALALDPFQLRKVLGLCAMPEGLVWLGLAAFACALFRAGNRRLAAAAVALWLLYTAAGNVWVGSVLTRFLERDFRGMDSMAAGPFDAVIVLGGGLEVREDGSGMISSAGDRVLLGARMLLAGRTKLLIASGPLVPLPGGRDVSYAEATKRFWVELGVPSEAIVTVTGPRTTSEEVRALKELIPSSGWRRVGVLTSAWHLRRAMRLCRRAGIDASPLPADVIVAKPFTPRSLIPQYEGFMAVHLACWELLGAALRR